jgi:phage host-nuclease inhibitor protein Gam
MKDYNKYIKKWQDLTIKMNEAIQKDNFELADKLLKESTDAYSRYKECCEYPSSNREKTFGELNYMFESELPRLYKENRKALKECTNFVLSDNNLRSQFNFLDSLRNYNCEGDSARYVTESVKLASEKINRKSLRESIKKYADLLSKYEIGGYTLDEDTVKFYKDCERVLCEQKNLSNLTNYTNSINSIASYIENHKAPVVESKDKVKTMSEELNKKIANLSEEEQSLVKDIIDFKAPMVETKREKLFNSLKNGCLSTIGKLKNESKNSEEVEGLNAIKEQIEGKIYCKETIVQDVAKLLEIRDILNDRD